MKTEISYDEKFIIQQVTQGNTSCFRELFNHYRDVLYSYSLKLTKSSFHAEEIVQEVFIKVWTNREKINPQLPFKPYLYRITKNHIINFLREAVKDEKLKHEIFFASDESHTQTEDKLVYDDYERFANEAIIQLPVKRKEIFRMSRLEGMSNEEISKSLGIAPSTVKDQLLKATKSLKAYLKDKADITISVLLLFFQNSI